MGAPPSAKAPNTPLTRQFTITRSIVGGNPLQIRVGIVGAGLMGAATTYHLAALGAKVTVFDSHSPGGGTSGSSFAWISASAPAIEDRDYFDLCHTAMSEVSALADDIGGEHWFQPSGHLRWAVHGSDTEKELLAHADQIAGYGYQVNIRSAQDVRESIEPTIQFESPNQPVLVFPQESWIDAPALIHRLLAAAKAHGAETVIGRTVTHIDTDSSSVTGVVLDDGSRYTLDVLVNAAGQWSGHIASLVGRDLPLLSSPGLVARLRSKNFRTTWAMHSPHVEIRPDGDCQMLLHSREIDAQLDASGFADDQQVDDLYTLAKTVIPDLETSRVIDARVGWRPLPLDTLPSVGRISTLGGYYELVTHMGAILAPMLGRLAATEIVTDQDSVRLAKYRPERDGLRTVKPGDVLSSS
ncbi:NAD(P)/FAD-dependent oxidoreductase [Rhodococcus sp. NPDC059968]|uniref:NAD(P)/FAD-dependent oxidoreductase n=1 Tax=Rhodococcus sp. NPDC059968 TaxID=3347017 RepID=UPI00366FE903